MSACRPLPSTASRAWPISTAGLTHYGTTAAPIVFAENYVSLREWWRVGFVVSVVNLTMWLTVGFAWWKFLGFW